MQKMRSSINDTKGISKKLIWYHLVSKLKDDFEACFYPPGFRETNIINQLTAS